MMAKPMKTLEFHCPMIQFLIIRFTFYTVLLLCISFPSVVSELTRFPRQLTDGALQTFHFVLLLVTGDFCINRLSDSDAHYNNTA